MEQFGGVRALRFFSLIMQFYRLVCSQGNAQVLINLESNSTPVVGEYQLVNCRVIGTYVFIIYSHPLDMTITCPVFFGCHYITMDLEQSKASLSFVADSTWNGAQVVCKLKDSPFHEHEAKLTINITDVKATDVTESSYTSAISTPDKTSASPATSGMPGTTPAVKASEPPFITPDTTATFFEGQRFNINCRAADESVADDLTWHVRCARDVTRNANADGTAAKACPYASHFGTDGFGEPALIFTFTATRDDWDGATVTCTSRTNGRSASVTMRTQPLPPITVSVDTISTYAGMSATATCFARKLWTASELSWSVRSQGGGSKCSIESDEPLPCGVRRVSFVASLDWNGAKLACAASTPYHQQSSEISVSVKPFPILKLSPSGPNLTISRGENATIFCAASEYFAGGALLWTTVCLAGPCPASRQGSLSETAGGRRFFVFQATGAWNGAMVLCSVARFPDSASSLTINVIEATQSAYETMLDPYGSNFILMVGLSTAATAALVTCVVTLAILFLKKAKNRCYLGRQSPETSFARVGASVCCTKPSVLKKMGVPELATKAAVSAGATRASAELRSNVTQTGLTSGAPFASTATVVSRGPTKRPLKSSRGAKWKRATDLMCARTTASRRT